MALLVPHDGEHSPTATDIASIPKSTDEFTELVEARAHCMRELSMFPTAMYVNVKTLKSTLQGSVKVTRHFKTGEEFALKESNVQLATRRTSVSGKRVMENVFREYRIMKLLQDTPHENVVSLLDAFIDDKRIYMVLEYCAGGELFDLIEKSGQLSEVTTREYFHQIAKGLKHMHERGVCHLDLSLENVFLSGSGVAKIGDFGVAREFKDGEDLFQSTYLERPGKLTYMAPEVYSYKEYHGRSADVFSAGVMLFTMAFGFPPFEHASTDDVRYRLVQNKGLNSLLKEWKLESKVSRELVNLLSKMLCPEKDRVSIEQVLEHPWMAQSE
jgi:serine/threonine protein kinase